MTASQSPSGPGTLDDSWLPAEIEFGIGGTSEERPGSSQLEGGLQSADSTLAAIAKPSNRGLRRFAWG